MANLVTQYLQQNALEQQHLERQVNISYWVGGKNITELRSSSDDIFTPLRRLLV